MTALNIAITFIITNTFLTYRKLARNLSLIIKTLAISFICFFTFSQAIAQEEGKPTSHGLKLDFKLPTGTSNKSFKGVLSGLADIDFSYQFLPVDNKLFFNGGFKYSHWNIESTIFSGNSVTGKLEFLQPFVGIGWRHTFSDYVFLEYEIKGGYSFVNTTSSSNPNVYKQQGIGIEPKLGMYYKANDLVAVGLTFNYNIVNAKFTPDNIAQTNFPGLGPEASKRIYQYFSVGFGIYTVIPKFK